MPQYTRISVRLSTPHRKRTTAYLLSAVAILYPLDGFVSTMHTPDGFMSTTISSGYPVDSVLVLAIWLIGCGLAYRPCVQQGSYSFEYGRLRNRSFDIGSCCLYTD